MKNTFRLFTVLICFCAPARAQTESGFAAGRDLIYKKAAEIGQFTQRSDNTRLEIFIPPMPRPLTEEQIKNDVGLDAMDNLSSSQVEDFVDKSFAKYKKEAYDALRRENPGAYDYIISKEGEKAGAAHDQIIKNYARSAQGTEITDPQFDYSSLILDGTQVLLIGEMHQHGANRDLLNIIKSVNSKNRLGYYATEYLSTEMAADVQKCRQSGNYSDFPSYRPHYFFKDYGYITRLNIKIISALDDKTEIIPLENVRSKNAGIFSYKPLKEGSKLLKEISGRESDITHFAAFTNEGINFRNIFWIKQLAPDFKKTGAEADNKLIVAHAGYKHVLYGAQSKENPVISVSQRLRNMGIKTTVIVLMPDRDLKAFGIINTEKAAKTPPKLIYVPEEQKNIIGADYILVHALNVD